MTTIRQYSALGLLVATIIAASPGPANADIRQETLTDYIHFAESP